MRTALSEHDKVLRDAIEEHDGFIFSHTGDGVVAAFASPRSAVDAAVEAQLALELPVRMGVATGEAELRDGDYFGAVLNRAARVMAAGHGGQILVADSTAGLLSGVDLLDLGPRRLRDVPMPVGVYQVSAPGLGTDFPALRALDTTPGNLRPATTSLIGREFEVAEVAAAVKAHRLVTLTGVGGVGKTRIALEAAERLADEFPDGVWVFELAAVTDPAAVPDAVAAVLGITQQPGKTVTESVAAALEGRIRLLVIDNCEHVLDAAADLIETIVKRSATVRLLTTSREGLGLKEEQLHPVRPLQAGAGTDSAAVSLFVERAQGISPGFSVVTGEEAAAVTEVCQRLDGIPLAIELAASRMASMTAIEMRDRLDHRFQLLIGSRRGLERHHTLRHAVAWSYDLLDDTEKTVLQHCSVFAGGFDLQSACAIVDDLDEYVVLDVLDTLVRKSLVVADRSAGRTRFSMLETIRQFGEEQLVTSGVAERVRTAHARYFAGREADILALWDSPRQGEAYAWFTVEQANLRAAFRWAADHADLDAAATIATYVGLLGYLVENYEAIAWAEELIERACAVNHSRLGFLYVVASQCYTTGRVEDSVRYAEAGMSVVVSGGAEVPLGLESLLCSPHVYAGQPEPAVEWCRSLIQSGLGRDTMSRIGLVISLSVARSYAEALDATDGLVEAAEATGNPWVTSFALCACGIAFMQRDSVAALNAARRGWEVAKDSNNRGNGAFLSSLLARLEAEYGDSLAALHYISLSIRNYHDSGNPTNLRTPMATLTTVLDRMGRYDAAATIGGFGFSPFAVASQPELGVSMAHVREVLDNPTFESLARKGETMSSAEMVAYAYDQIDQARAELSAVPK